MEILTAEDFIRLDTSKRKAGCVKEPKPGSEVFVWFPTKRPPIEVIKALHPGILDVRLPRQNTARFCILVFTNKLSAAKAREMIHGMKYEGSKGRKLRAKMKKLAPPTGNVIKTEDSLDERDSTGPLILEDLIKKEEPETPEETVPVKKMKHEQKQDTSMAAVTRKLQTPKRYWNMEPGSLVRIKPEIKVQSSGKTRKFKNRKGKASSTPKSEPGSILRIKPKTKSGKLKQPRKSL